MADFPAHAYRAQTVSAPMRPAVWSDCRCQHRLRKPARDRYGFELPNAAGRIAEADDIDASAVGCQSPAPEIADALLASGKHVLCKSRSHRPEDAEAGHGQGRRASASWHRGFSYRRSRRGHRRADQVRALGEIVHFNGRYWCDTPADADAPTSWPSLRRVLGSAPCRSRQYLIDMSEQPAADRHS